VISFYEFGIALAGVAVLALMLFAPGRTRAAIAAGAGAVVAFVVGVAWSRHRSFAAEQARTDSAVDAIMAAIEHKDADAVFDDAGNVSTDILNERL
jgi:hypothetical protein